MKKTQHSLIWTLLLSLLSIGLIWYAYVLGLNHGADRIEKQFVHIDTIQKELEEQQSIIPQDCVMEDGVKKCQTSWDTPTVHTMSMDDMTRALAWKTGNDLDRAFLETMIPHHQGAIDMAQYLTGAEHEELRKLGEEIIKTQSAEIATMEQWRKDWGYTTSDATPAHTGSDGALAHTGVDNASDLNTTHH